MRIVVTLLLIIISFNLFAQNKVAGHYRNYFFSDIQLNRDSTFAYNWYHDNNGRWAKGTWSSNGNTVYLHVVTMYDTLSIVKSNGTTADTLILSQYSTPRRVTPQQLAEVIVGSFEQNGTWFPDKLVFKYNRLYEVKNGSLVTEKRQGIRKEYDPWYFKIYE